MLKFFSAWGWQILAIIFLTSTCIIVALPINLTTVVFSIVFLSMFIGCEYMALKRKKEFYNENND